METTNGYILYGIPNKDGVIQHCRANQLVARAFFGIDPGREYVDHIDRNPLNNHISNLRWATPQENSFYARRRTEYEHIVVDMVKSGKTVREITEATGLGRWSIQQIKKDYDLCRR